MNNFVKEQLQSYLPCKKFLEEYEDQLNEFDYLMQGRTSASVIVPPDGNPEPAHHRISKWQDRKEQYIFDHEYQVRHCEEVMRFCEWVFEKVKPEYQEVFRYVFQTQSTPQWIAEQTGYGLSTIYDIIDRETERIKKI